jgi:Cu+-exporting ATPase
MHREYSPDDLRHLHVLSPGADGPAHDHGHHHHDHGHHHHDHDHAPHHRTLFAFTVALGLLLVAALVLPATGLARPPRALSPAFLAAVLGGARIVYGALEALLAGRLGADFALAQACLAALVLGEDFVAAEVVFIAMLGECLEAFTADRAFRAIGNLFARTPRTARVRREGVESEVPVEALAVGDTVLVAPGETVAVDGVVLAGRSSVDESALTGEPLPVDRGPGEPVFAGTLNQFGQLDVRAERVGTATTLGQVLRLVAESRRKKSPLERAADRYARRFLPVVEAVALATLLAGYLLGWPDVWHRTVAILVVACPCALVLATPAAVLAATAWLARHGIVIKGGAALERLAACDTLAFDKTGTLTRGAPEASGASSLSDWDADDVLRLAASAEGASRHPLAAALRSGAEARGLALWPVEDPVAHPGVGVEARWRPGPDAPPRRVLVGNARLMAEHGVDAGDAARAALADLDARGETPLLVALDGALLGVVGVRDPLRPEAHDVVHDLKHAGFTEVAILTGDREAAARVVGKRTHIKTVHAGLLPADKADWVRSRQEAGRRVAMIGDGLNDAPALAVAHVGIALGRAGADLAAEAGDVVLLGEPLRRLPDLVRLSRQTVRILKQNIIGFAFGLNAVAMAAAALGVLGPVAAAVLHQAASLLVLLNAMRLLVFAEAGDLPPARALRALGAAIRRVDDRLAPGALLAWLGARRRGCLRLAAGLAIVAYATWGWTAIAPDEVGLVRRFGRMSAVLGPGLHFRLPPPLEAVTRLRPGAIRGVELGFRTVPDREGSGAGALRWESGHGRESGVVARPEEEALLVTGDGRYVELAAVAQVRLDPRPEALRRHAFGVADPDVALRALAESAVRAAVAREPLEALLTGRRSAVEASAAALLQRRIDRAGLGLAVAAVAFQDVHPPRAVVDAYRDVTRAELDAQRRRNAAATYADVQRHEADGRSTATLAAASGAAAARASRAGAEAEVFAMRRDARADAPALSDRRRAWEALEATLAGRPKLLLDPPRAAARRHLVLTDVPPALLPALAPAEMPTPPPPPPRTSR